METVAAIETIRQRVTTIEFLSNGIVYIKIDDNCEMTLADSMGHYKILKDRFDGITKFRLLVEPGLFTSISPEARSFSANPDNNKMTIASAVIIKSLAHRLIINFMIHVTQKHTMKMRMFESKHKALEWLLSINPLS